MKNAGRVLMRVSARPADPGKADLVNRINRKATFWMVAGAVALEAVAILGTAADAVRESDLGAGTGLVGGAVLLGLTAVVGVMVQRNEGEREQARASAEHDLRERVRVSQRDPL